MAKQPLGTVIGGKSFGWGEWPDTGKNYPPDGYVNRMGGVRKSYLPFIQRFEAQEAELNAAKATGRQPVLDNHARARNLSEAIKARDAAIGHFNELELGVEDFIGGLKPFDRPPDHYSAEMERELRTVMRTADGKTRQAMMKEYDCRAAALAEGATPYNSGLSPEEFKHYRQARLQERHPQAFQMQEDFNARKSVVKHQLTALGAQIDLERRALGIPASEPKQTPVPEWE